MGKGAIEMNFIEATEAMISGKIVYRKNWGDHSLKIQDGKYYFIDSAGSVLLSSTRNFINIGDVYDDEWFTREEQGDCVSFEEACRAMFTEGKKIRRKAWTTKDFTVEVKASKEGHGYYWTNKTEYIDDVNSNDWIIVE